MKIKTIKGIMEVHEVFPDLETFKNHVLKLDKNIKYDNDQIKVEIEKLFLKLVEQEGFISYSLMRGWLIKNYNFKTKKWGELKYWIERGWLEKDALDELKRRNMKIKQRNHLCVDYWINKGYTKEESINLISESQRKNSKNVKIRHGKSKKMLKEKGYTEDEIKKICLTPSNIDFWVKKGFSVNDAKQIISKNQSNASKHVNYKKRILSNNIEYWLKLGFSDIEAKQKLSERQRTFTLEKCIQKYGEKEGNRKFTERQNKWINSLLNNNNFNVGYSKSSQELFYNLLETYYISDRDTIYFATHNGEYRINKKESSFWLYDFTDLKNKKIIEFNGDMFHGNPKKYASDDNPHPFRKKITAQEIWDKDKNKIDIAKENGFDVLVIWDSEYRWGDKQDIVNKCVKFLKNK